MIKYRLYSTYGTIHTVKRVDTIEEVIKEIEKIIYKEDAHYLVVKEDYENNTDIPYATIFSIEEFNDFKENYFEDTKGYGKSR